MATRRGEGVALMAGGGLLLWWLLRKRGGGPTGPAGGGAAAPPAATAATPCKLRLSGDGLLLDGKPATVSEAVAACRASGRAELLVTGDASWGKLEELAKGLRAADVAIAEQRPAPRAADPSPPSPSPATPRPARGRRVTRSTHDETGTVKQAPEALLSKARELVPDLTMDEYTAARLAASEHGSGSLAELAAIIDAELNRAERRGKSLFESLTWRGTFGKQGSRRVASTRLDPYEIHIQVAREVLGGERRGASQGATRFFDPRTQRGLSRQGKACPPLVILKRWAFGYPWRKIDGKRQGCELDRRRPGRELLEWVGEIDGVDPIRLLLMRPAVPGPDHVSRYLAARELIETRLLGGKAHA